MLRNKEIFNSKEIYNYWVTVKPQMAEGMTKGYQRKFDNLEDARNKYVEFAFEYDNVELIEERCVISYQSLEHN